MPAFLPIMAARRPHWWIHCLPCGVLGCSPTMSERLKISLACSECQARNHKTTRRPDQPGPIKLKKYCPSCNKHTVHQETK
jgi:large subunit ribosomal protein L33